ncbi:hypothetical protein H072_4160 [Dactylellina haptotyla CBS 200.50]|uniref:Dynactin subunit 4 n=1 Tax=Dactylellina haptotyla (strain CBS 200.50) TaxID=1284197 RepID=S8C2M9_DACHA|nr:hypothetical protein H072_4160 [Dactylellina haptotyla CBS 200.50]
MDISIGVLDCCILEALWHSRLPKSFNLILEDRPQTRVGHPTSSNYHFTMSASFPYIHISCPCNEERPQIMAVDSARPLSPTKSPTKRDFAVPVPSTPLTPVKRRLFPGTSSFDGTVATSGDADGERNDEEDDEDEENNFDPHDQRAAFSLFPIENLLYCEDCHQIRCPRCVTDEIVCWYCPSCLFEVPSSTVKSDGNRCTRNCYLCPICTALLVVIPVNHIPSSSSAAEQQQGPFNLFCSHCHWTTSDLSPPLQLEKPTSISAQLAKVTPSAHDAEFNRLKQHYAQQLGNAQEDFTNSPAALTRLMGLYTGLGAGGSGHAGGRKGRGVKKLEMKEIDRPREVVEEREMEIVEQMAKLGIHATTNTKQRLNQPHEPRFLSELRPTAVLLRTKRSKRCRACRHILVKPESKVQTTRFRIRLVALNYIPSLTIKRLDPSIQLSSLVPHKTHRFLLTVTNPLFDPISVSLLTPRYTPGTDYPSRVTILCPEFDVGANTDVWDDALMSTRTPAPVPTPPPQGNKDPRMATVYEQKRNYTSVVIEVVPAEIPDTRVARIRDERLLEIPIFVRVEFEAEVDREDEEGGGGGTSSTSGKHGAPGSSGGGGNPLGREKVEYSYWCVVGVGRVGDPVEGVVASEPNTPVRTPVATPVKAPRTPGVSKTPLRQQVRA